MDERKLTQKQYADELKLFKIYDAGQRLYVKKSK
jgi:sulfur relay (sulfurtransferase) DsrF/TusC family protein